MIFYTKLEELDSLCDLSLQIESIFGDRGKLLQYKSVFQVK